MRCTQWLAHYGLKFPPLPPPLPSPPAHPFCRGKVVMDVGAGSGILSLFAAQVRMRVWGGGRLAMGSARHSKSSRLV